MEGETFTVNSVPYAPGELVTKGKKNAYLLLEPNTPNWIVVNAIGRDILTLCDGTKTVKEITEELCEKYGEPYDESIDSVLKFVNEAKGKRFLQEDPFPPPQRSDKEIISLNTVWLNVTNKCNLRCIHCHLSSGEALKNEMATQELMKVIDEMKDLVVKEVVISGGEPLVRGDILEILEYASQQDIEKLSLITNGTLITNEIVEKLKKLEKLHVQVSLDGAKKETHEFIRGKGTYENIIDGIKKLVNAEVNCFIGMTVMGNNMNEMQGMAELSKRLGLNYLHFSILQEKGRAKENQSVHGLDNEDYISVIKKMKKISSLTNVRISVEERIRNKIERLSKVDLCGAGSSIISVAADGNVYPCAGLHEKGFCAGNIREQSLKDIWKTSEVFKKFRSFSVLDIEECKNCELKFICGGGCHVKKYNVYGGLYVPSVRCKAYKKIFSDIFSEKIKKPLKNAMVRP